MGGYIAASAAMIDAVRSYAPQFIFTTTIPPSIAASAAAAVRHLKASSAERERHQAMARLVKHAFRAAGLPVLDNPSHIVPLMVGDAAKCKARERNAARPPRDLHPADQLSHRRQGTERLRITPTPRHTEAQVASLVEALVDVWKTLGSAVRGAAHRAVPPPGGRAGDLRLSRDEEGGGVIGAPLRAPARFAITRNVPRQGGAQHRRGNLP